ncbi:alpha/beta hydrolase-fold protein [Caulobacter sp. 73W]|uniref:Alpha/beta hydrolase-fold protein n=1 Tax=Caulobacter sp. 73W TaxID=3161137 RepID=A0AB39KWE4_9CAUL
MANIAWSRLTRPWGAQAVDFRPARETCGASGALRYCIYRDEKGTNGDVLYHLHGRNLDEQIWNDETYLTGMLQGQWQARGSTPPTVVTLSYGPTWLLTPKGERSDSGLLDDLKARLPEIESKTGAPRRRMLLGESMGGLNVLIAGLSDPKSFKKVAALCPGVYVDSPFELIGHPEGGDQTNGRQPQDGLRRWDARA